MRVASLALLLVLLAHDASAQARRRSASRSRQPARVQMDVPSDTERWFEYGSGPHLRTYIDTVMVHVGDLAQFRVWMAYDQVQNSNLPNSDYDRVVNEWFVNCRSHSMELVESAMYRNRVLLLTVPYPPRSRTRTALVYGSPAYLLAEWACENS